MVLNIQFEICFLVLVNLYADGKVVATPPELIDSVCDFDMEHFPYDRKCCRLEFGSWTYTNESINLTTSTNVSLIDYQGKKLRKNTVIRKLHLTSFFVI